MVKEDFDKVLKTELAKLSNYAIEIGVITSHSVRKITVGVTNAELMFIHENGSPIRNIPSRPVLQMTIDYANKSLLNEAISKATDEFINSDFNILAFEKELNKLCMRMENYAREIIYSNDGRLTPNAPKVAAKKKGNHPLFDTGQLARSITCRLVKS